MSDGWQIKEFTKSVKEFNYRHTVQDYMYQSTHSVNLEQAIKEDMANQLSYAIGKLIRS